MSPLPIDTPAPDFTARDLSGSTWRLSDLRGQVVVLYFWSPQCGWCERWDPILRSYQAEWGQRARVLAVAPEPHDEADTLAQAARASGLPVVLPDPRQEITRAYQATNTPHLFVIDPGGVLRYQGAFNDVTFRQRTASHAYLYEAVQAVLSGRAPEPAETAAYGCAITPAAE